MGTSIPWPWPAIPGKGPNQYISQAYVFGKPLAGVPLRIDAGKFFSSVGAEVPQSYLDFNASRSLLFWFGSPLYHVGLRASMPVTEHFTAGLQLLSGCNTVTGAHGHQTVAATAAWAGKKWGFSQLYMGCNERLVGSGWRQLSDSVLTYRLSNLVTAYGEILAAVEKRPAPGYDRWYGWAAASRFSPAAKWSLSPRVEWYNDPDGATTGVAQHLAELSLTAEYRPARVAIARLEYRHDWSDRPFFHTTADGVDSRRGHALIAGITLLLSQGL